jgi:hypothetical protein
LLQYNSNKYYIFWVYVCSLSYPARNARAPYCILSVACPALQYFSTLSHKRHDFRKKMLLNIKCVFWFSAQICLKYFFHSKKNPARYYKNVYWSSCTVQILMKFKFSRQIFAQNNQVVYFLKIRRVGAVLTEGCDVVGLRNFANASKNDWTSSPPPILCLRFVNREGFTSLPLIHYFDSLIFLRVASFVFDISLSNPSMRSVEYTLYPPRGRESNNAISASYWLGTCILKKDVEKCCGCNIKK